MTRQEQEMTSTFWTDGYRDAKAGNPYSPPAHSATSVYTAEYQRGYNAYFDQRDAQWVAELKRRGLWLTDEQKQMAGL